METAHVREFRQVIAELAARRIPASCPQKQREQYIEAWQEVAAEFMYSRKGQQSPGSMLAQIQLTRQHDRMSELAFQDSKAVMMGRFTMREDFLLLDDLIKCQSLATQFAAQHMANKLGMAG